MRLARTLPLAAALLGLAALGAAPAARADNVYWSIGISSGGPVYTQPAPVYAPPPVYVYPQPIYTPPRVVYTPPRVVYPAPVYLQPAQAWPPGQRWRHPHGKWHGKGHGKGHGHGHHGHDD